MIETDMAKGDFQEHQYGLNNAALWALPTLQSISGCCITPANLKLHP